ncbi:hypothetical protein BD410DRAFT_785030 [Rickenella mellea]|uniref:Uncharacterized protein n=1 Tax=Rickenella mellea TaxID=50990 RepID=A0A4Y7QC85_9AGAM|nr:hypothetical protein BD410DRAFT_785030 [Rickenella mellea]
MDNPDCVMLAWTPFIVAAVVGYIMCQNAYPYWEVPFYETEEAFRARVERAVARAHRNIQQKLMELKRERENHSDQRKLPTIEEYVVFQ